MKTENFATKDHFQALFTQIIEVEDRFVIDRPIYFHDWLNLNFFSQLIDSIWTQRSSKND